MLRIAIFTDTFTTQANGTAKIINRLTDYLPKKDISFQLFSAKGPFTNQASHYVNQFPSVPFFLYPECRFAAPNFIKIKRKLQDFQPNIIHIATPLNLGLCGLYHAKSRKIPLIGSYDTNFKEYLTYYNIEQLSSVAWKYMRWFYRSFDKILVPLQGVKQVLEEQKFQNVSLWTPGVDGALFHPEYDRFDVRLKYNIKRPYILTYVGCLRPEKNVSALLEIARHLPPHIKHQVHWIIVGDGPLKETLQKDSLEHMTFTGLLRDQDLAKVYAASDLFVSPFQTETFEDVVLESLASGTPVIGADSAGIQTVVTHGENGYLCETNSTEEFSNYISLCLEHPDLRKKLGLQARRYALTQTWDRVFDRLLTYYTILLEKEKMNIQFA